MLVVALLTLRSDAPPLRERLQRRVSWQYPPSVQVVGEYWLNGAPPEHPRIITILETENAASLLPIQAAWSDMYDIAVFPALTAEEGLKLASQLGWD
jgi:hypothetical protein